MNNITLTRKLALTGAFSALVIVLGITRLGFIPIGAASVTILHVPVILICTLAGLGGGIFVGAVFGILSLVMAAMSPSSVLDPFFVNPLCSVLPRVLFAFAAWGLWTLLAKLLRLKKPVAAGITGFITTIVHTLLVIGCIYVFKGADVRAAMGGLGYFALIGVVLPNAIFEAIAAAVICVAVYAGLFIAGNRKSKLSAESQD